ncbi:hypothetical protein CRYPD_13 [uncultured Candidatus Thioglobus sp.]|nr:hypothetical protein CRYPD_13 [uncultured Candidatus Thioglobus sp.]
MVCNSEQVVVNHGLLCCAKGCEIWRVKLSQWLRIKVCYAEPVNVIDGEFYCASGCESWFAMLRQWL